MPLLQEALIARLAGDATLMQILQGGVLNRPLKQSGPGSTPTAWVAAAGSGVLHLRPCAVILDPNEVAHPQGWSTRDALGVDAFAVLSLYAETTATGKAALDAADARTIALLHNWKAALADGRQISVLALPERAGLVDSSTFPGSFVTTRRFRCTAARLIQEAA